MKNSIPELSPRLGTAVESPPSGRAGRIAAWIRRVIRSLSGNAQPPVLRDDAGDAVLGGRYRLGTMIGRGGMGAVYAAVDERLERPVAVKLISISEVPEAKRELLRARFHREARAAARIAHPNVITVYDFGTDEATGQEYLVMELLQGEDLASWMLRQGAGAGDRLRILRGAAQGVAAGHRSGLVHRDIKPANIFISSDARGLRVRVLDFGIARFFSTEATATHLTSLGLSPLTPAYAAPEQFRAGMEASPASDVFSLGRVGFELLTGKRPYAGIDCTDADPDAPPPVPSVRSLELSVPARVAAAIERALAYRPEDRPADADAFAAALTGGDGESSDGSPVVQPEGPEHSFTSRSGSSIDADPAAPTTGSPIRQVGSDNRDTAQRGRDAVQAALAERGITQVREERRGMKHVLRVRVPDGGQSVSLFVKTRRSGTWQTSTREGDPDPAPTPTPTFWVFVDFAPARPEFYVVPDCWIRKDIYENHQAYLARHGGRRAESPDATHHAIALDRIRAWKDRWDLLGLSADVTSISTVSPSEPEARTHRDPVPVRRSTPSSGGSRYPDALELRGKVLRIAPEVLRSGNPRRPDTHGWLAFEVLRRADGGTLPFDEYRERLFNPSPEIQEMAKQIPGVRNAYQDFRHIRHDIRLGRVMAE